MTLLPASQGNAQEAGIAAGRLGYAYSAMSLSGQEPAVVSEES